MNSVSRPAKHLQEYYKQTARLKIDKDAKQYCLYSTCETKTHEDIAEYIDNIDPGSKLSMMSIIRIAVHYLYVILSYQMRHYMNCLLMLSYTPGLSKVCVTLTNHMGSVITHS